MYGENTNNMAIPIYRVLPYPVMHVQVKGDIHVSYTYMYTRTLCYSFIYIHTISTYMYMYMYTASGNVGNCICVIPSY